MTDEQLLEEYNKEIFDFDGSGPWTILQILAQSRQFREHSKNYREIYAKAHQLGYERGVEKAKRDYVKLDDLRKMTIQELANLLGEDT